MDPKIRQAGLNAQGIIHLEKKELEKMEGFLRAMIQEQEEQEEYSVDAKSAYLLLILVLLSRVKAAEDRADPAAFPHKEGSDLPCAGLY